MTNACFLTDSKTSWLSLLGRCRPKEPRISTVDVYCWGQSCPRTRTSHLAPCTGTLGNGPAWFTVSEISDYLNSGVKSWIQWPKHVCLSSQGADAYGDMGAFILGPSSFYYNNLKLLSIFTLCLCGNGPPSSHRVCGVNPITFAHFPLPLAANYNGFQAVPLGLILFRVPAFLLLGWLLIFHISQPPHALCMTGL